MGQHDIRSASRPDPDQPMVEIADYVIDARIDSQEAYDTARYMLLDSLACAMLAMKFEGCTKHLGPLAPGGELAEHPRQRPEVAQGAFAGQTCGEVVAHDCLTRYGDTVLRCSSMSSARPSAGNARCGQLSRSQTRQPAPIGVAMSPDKSSPSE